MGTRLIWSMLSVLLGLTWVGLVLADGWYASDHLWGQRVSELQGHAALLGLGLILVSRWIPPLRSERRWLGLLTFGFAVVHTVSSVEHDLGGRWEGLLYISPTLQVGVGLGLLALGLMLPLALTSFDRAVRTLGPWWQRLHRLVWPAAGLAVLHTLLTGVHYLGTNLDAGKIFASLALLVVVVGVATLNTPRMVAEWKKRSGGLPSG